MRISFDRFRQIFWMVISLIFLLLFCVYIMTNLYSYKTESARGIEIITRTNKITGRKAYKAITEDGETSWTTTEDIINKKEAKTKSEKK